MPFHHFPTHAVVVNIGSGGDTTPLNIRPSDGNLDGFQVNKHLAGMTLPLGYELQHIRHALLSWKLSLVSQVTPSLLT